jgi:CTP-dependent riboflavin kinase
MQKTGPWNRSGRSGLIAGNLNVELDEYHAVKRDFILPVASRNDGRREDLYFEECLLLVGSERVLGLIARTSTNYHGHKALEIIAKEHLRNSCGRADGPITDVQVRTNNDESLAQSR